MFGMSLSESIEKMVKGYAGSSFSTSFDGEQIAQSELEICCEAISETAAFLADHSAETISLNESAVAMVQAKNYEGINTLNEGRMEAIKEKIKKFWEMVKGFFKKLGAKLKFTIDSYMKSGEALVEKYGDKIGDAGKVEIKGYNYIDFTGWSGKCKSVTESELQKISAAFNNSLVLIKDNSRAKAFGRASDGSGDRDRSEEDRRKNSDADSKLEDEALKNWNKSVGDESEPVYIASIVNKMTSASVKNGTTGAVLQELLKKGRGGSTEKKVIKVSSWGTSKIKEILTKGQDFSDLTDIVDACQDLCDNAKEVQEKAAEAAFKEGETYGVSAKDKMSSRLLKKNDTLLACTKTVIGAMIALSKEQYSQAKTAFVAVYQTNNNRIRKQNASIEFSEDAIELELLDMDLESAY